MNEHTRNVLVIFALTLVVGPYFIQGAYTTSDRTLYEETDVILANLGTWYCQYWNSSGLSVINAVDKSLVSNGTFTFDINNTAQDLDLYADLQLYWGASTLWNVTAFLSSTTDRITQIGLRIGSTLEGQPLIYDLGFSATPHQWIIVDDGILYTNDDTLTYITISSTTLANIEKYEVDLAGKMIFLRVHEDNANQFVDAATIEVEMHFYSASNNDLMDQYLGIFGITFILMAIGMTRAYDMTPNRRRRGTRRRFRRRRYRRSYR